MLARHTDPRVIPLEVWDLEVDGVPLYDAPRDRRFGARLVRAVEALRAGTARSESGGRFPEACRAIARVVLAGGRAAEVVVAETGVPFALGDATPFAGIRGGEAILARRGVRGAVCDLGQSAVKVAWGARRIIRVRDVESIPMSPRPPDERGRDALVAFVAGALADATRATKGSAPEAIVLALPCDISAGGVIGSCSYPWRAGDATLAAEILACAGLAGVPVILLNDAELAALSVAEEGRDHATTLVLTIGFGVGGALLPART